MQETKLWNNEDGDKHKERDNIEVGCNNEVSDNNEHRDNYEDR